MAVSGSTSANAKILYTAAVGRYIREVPVSAMAVPMVPVVALLPEPPV